MLAATTCVALSLTPPIHHADAAEGIEGDERRRTFEEFQVADAGPRIHRDRLAVLTDAEVPERQIRLFTPHVHEAGTAGEGEVHFDAEVGELAQLAEGLQTSAAEARAVLDVAQLTWLAAS